MTPIEKPATPVVATAPSAPAKTATSKKPARTAAAKPAAKTSKTVAAATPKATVARKAAVNTPKKAGTVTTKAKTSAKPAAQPAAAKASKAKKPKMVRDSFTIPKPEYDVLDVLKLRAAKLGNPVKKTELIRAGVKAIAALLDAALKQALLAVPSLKTGRPAKAKKA